MSVTSVLSPSARAGIGLDSAAHMQAGTPGVLEL